MNVAVSDFRSRASEILSKAQEEDVLIANHGKSYAVVISQERYNQLISNSQTGLELLGDLEKVALEDNELEHPHVTQRPIDL